MRYYGHHRHPHGFSQRLIKLNEEIEELQQRLAELKDRSRCLEQQIQQEERTAEARRLEEEEEAAAALRLVAEAEERQRRMEEEERRRRHSRAPKGCNAR